MMGMFAKKEEEWTDDVEWQALLKKVRQCDAESSRTDANDLIKARRLKEESEAAEDEWPREDKAGAARTDAGDDEFRPSVLVNLSNCNLVASDVETLCDRVLSPSEYCHVTHLVLGANPEMGNDGAFALASALANNRTLETLHLFNCGLSDDAAGALTSCLRSHQKISELLVYKNDISRDMEQTLKSVLKAKPEVGNRVKAARA